MHTTHSGHPGQTTRLRLADHVRACRVGDTVVLLDLRHGRYMGLGGKQAQRLGGAIDGWPIGDAACAADVHGADLAGLTRPLLSKGLLTTQVALRSAHAEVDEPQHSLDGHDGLATIKPGLHDLRQVAQAAAVASLWLRWRSMHAIVSSVEDRRARDRAQHRETGDGVLRVMTMKQLQPAVVTFNKLRPLVFTARDRCLLDSLALINFLAAQRLYPSWIIGVKTSPFRAHSWVQCGDLVLNDQFENVRRFKPILVV
jgi:hypothetical protein